jgi:hypothetical protein
MHRHIRADIVVRGIAFPTGVAMVQTSLLHLSEAGMVDRINYEILSGLYINFTLPSKFIYLVCVNFET